MTGRVEVLAALVVATSYEAAEVGGYVLRVDKGT